MSNAYAEKDQTSFSAIAAVIVDYCGNSLSRVGFFPSDIVNFVS